MIPPHQREPLLVITLSSGNKIQKKKKRGPKPKKISERAFNIAIVKPIRRREISWSQAQKVRVLTYLTHHRIPIEPDIRIPAASTNAESTSSEVNPCRSPTQTEASQLFGVPQRTISEWVKKENNIESMGGVTHPNLSTFKIEVTCKWSEIESQLYNRFIQAREKGQAIRREWFRRHSMEIFMTLYPTMDRSLFRFSNGWFGGFLRRYRISLRAVTKKAQKVYLNLTYNIKITSKILS